VIGTYKMMTLRCPKCRGTRPVPYWFATEELSWCCGHVMEETIRCGDFTLIISQWTPWE